jgi:transposase InsO family protein
VNWEKVAVTGREEQVPIRRLCQVLDISRSQYYRKVNGMRDYFRRSRDERVRQEQPPSLAERAQELALKYRFYGHRKIHALLRREGFSVSLYQVYKLLKRKNLCLPSTWRKDLRERSKALKQYLRRPEKPLELLQADITDVPVENYGTYYVIDLIDYYSKYTLVTFWSDTKNTAALKRACDLALEEARRLELPIPEKIKLLTDNGPAMISKGFRTYIAGSPFVHLRTKSHRPETIGCIERFHQTLKYEEVWGAMYENPLIAKERIEIFRVFYNTERIHQTLGYKTPLEVIEEWKLKHKQSTDQTTYAHVA